MTLHDKLETIFKDAFGVEQLTDDMSIDTVDGWDSMAHVALIMALQKEFDITITPADAIELTDVAAVKNFLKGQRKMNFQNPEHDNLFLKSKRVCLRNFQADDIKIKVQWLNDPEVNRNLILHESIEYDKTLTWYNNAKSDVSRKDLVIDVEGSKSIGCVGLRKIDILNKSACFYILIGEKKYWGQGFAKEASLLLFEWAFKRLRLNKIWSNVASYNTASLALLGRIGFIQEGYLREEEILNGKNIDIVRFGLLASDFIKTLKK